MSRTIDLKNLRRWSKQEEPAAHRLLALCSILYSCSAVLAVPGVLFCGYKVPHPLEPRTLLRIQTDGRLTPIQALRTGCERIIAQINQVRSSFQTEVSIRMPGGAGVGNLEDLNGAHGGGAGGYGYGAQGGDGYVDI